MTPTDLEGRAALTRAVGDPEVFANELWANRPQHRKATDAVGFGDLLSLDDVDLIISSTGLRLPAFRLVKDGKTLAASRYTKTTRTGSHAATGVIDSRAVFDEFAAGATIVFQSMHRYWEPLARYCRALEISLGHPVQANAYITPPGAQGFGAHEDEHDVFVLQSHGTKQWRVHDLHDLDSEKPLLIEAMLAPGDSLYIPAGFPHSASTQERASVHVTVGILTVTWAAALDEAVKAVKRDPEVQTRLPLRYATADESFDQEVGSTLERFASMISGLDPAPIAHRLRRKVLASRQPMLRGQIHRLLALEDVGPATVVIRREGSICELEIVDDELSVLLGDRELRMPRHVQEAMAMLASGRKVVASDLPNLDSAGCVVLVRRLIREGLLEVVA